MAQVLIVDDEASVRRTVRQALDSRGITSEAAGDGREALLALCAAAVEGRRYDALVLDIAMPVVDGWQVLGAVRSNPLWKDIKIITLTAVANGTADVARIARYDGLFLEKDAAFPRIIGELVERVLRNGDDAD